MSPIRRKAFVRGVRRAQREQATLQRDILRLREQLYTEWEQKFTELRHLLQEC